MNCSEAAWHQLLYATICCAVLHLNFIRKMFKTWLALKITKLFISHNLWIIKSLTFWSDSISSFAISEALWFHNVSLKQCVSDCLWLKYSLHIKGKGECKDNRLQLISDWPRKWCTACNPCCRNSNSRRLIAITEIINDCYESSHVCKCSVKAINNQTKRNTFSCIVIFL